MNYKLQEPVHDIETPGLNNPETHVLTHNGFNTYLVLIFSDLNQAQIYKKPYRDSPHHEIQLLMSFNYLIMFRRNEHTEDYHIRKPNDENFLFEIGDKKYACVGDKVVSFETNDKIVKYSSDLGFNDFKYPKTYAEENIYFIPRHKFILIQGGETSTEKNNINFYIKKMEN